MESLDLLCIQEHWLHVYEKTMMSTKLPGWRNQTVCYDEVNHDDHNIQHQTGRGGVSTLWKPWLDPFVQRKENDGNERIIVTLFNIPCRPLCIINCYLSSGTSSKAISTYRADMDVLYTTLQKYRQRYEVLLTGDMNEDHHHRLAVKEKLFLDLIRDFTIVDLGALDPSPSYINPHLGHQSRIDHILILPRSAIDVTWKNSTLMTNVEAVNTSKHLPLETCTLVDLSVDVEKEVTPKACRKIFKWEEADWEVFRDALSEEVESLPIKNMDTNDALIALQQAIRTATICAVPYKDVKNYSAKRNVKWTPELAKAVENSKTCLYAWKQAGCPRDNHPTWLKKKKATREVRKVLRRAQASERETLLNDISKAAVNDESLFHKLVNRQRKEGESSSAININGCAITDANIIREEWATYYEDLARPKEEQPRIDSLVQHMRVISDMSTSSSDISQQDIKSAIRHLHNGKAADKEGFRAEHLKMLCTSNQAVEAMAHIFTRVLREKRVPQAMKSAYKIPIAKKGKDPLQMDNYRGITITSIFGKVLETICLDRHEQDLNYGQSGLQYGFTRGRSPAMASLLITESLAEAADMKEDIYVCSLDARKAFDVVSHNRLKTKLFALPLPKDIWRLVDDLYTTSTEVIRWHGIDSQEYLTRQGVKQGAILSPTLYKIYANDLSSSLSNSGMGMHIGPIFVGAPGCADDLLLLANSGNELQGMMEISFEHSKENVYDLHPVKSVVCPQKVRKSSANVEHEWLLGGNPVTVAKDYVHLGLEWHANKMAPDVAPRINTARRTAYTLMGVGLHGNGLDPIACTKLVHTFVLPRLLYGLEAAILTKTQIQQLTTFHRQLLRRIQGLPDSTAVSACHLLSGTIPVEGALHLKQLSLFTAVTRLEATNPLHQVATRQLAIKSNTSRSWFSNVVQMSEDYGIDAHHMLQHPSPKLPWKRHVDTLVRNQWINKLWIEASSKSTLKWLILDQTWIGRPHPVWIACRGGTYAVAAATTRARLLAGRLTLQSDRAKFHPKEQNPTCRLCNQGDEDTLHFVVTCQELEAERRDSIQKLCSLYGEEELPPPETTEELCYAILNGWGYIPTQNTLNGLTHKSLNSHKTVIALNKNVIDANMICSSLCHRLRKARDSKLFNLIRLGQGFST